MPEYSLKTGEKIVAQLVDGEDENYIYLLQVIVHNIDGSQTYYYRYWVRKADIEAERPAEAAEPAVSEALSEPGEEKPRRRRK
ncbi:MAG: hypothetical protein QXU87_04035 [Candidatus Caldarchaeum sp.]